MKCLLKTSYLINLKRVEVMFQIINYQSFLIH